MVKTFRRSSSALFAFLLAFLAMVSLPMTAQAQYNGASASKYAAVVIDAETGEVLYARRADSPRYPASISKVMTLYLTFEALAAGRLKLTDQIVMSRHAASQQPTKLGLAAGRTLSVDEAIQAMTIKSANDVAVAMAEHLGGTESRFAAMMSLKAQELGMNNTRFVNASGLPDSRQVSSARDVAILSRAVMTNFPQYYHYFGQNSFRYAGVTMNNHNNLLRTMQGVDGLKTGFTNASGYNLAASATRNGHRLIAVLLGGTSNPTRDNEVQRLLTVGFDIGARRDQGEQLASTQSEFDPGRYTPTPAANSAVQLASYETDEGEGDSDIDAPRGDYIVQVGAFRKKSEAQTQLADVGRRFSSVFADVQASVGDAVNGFFRAQYTGFTAETARQACATLQAGRVTCMVVAP